MTRWSCTKCGYQSNAEVHIEICPKCKAPMQMIVTKSNIKKKRLNSCSVK